MLILSGDIGATNSRFAVIKVAGRKLRIVRQQNFKNKDFAKFSDILIAFRSSKDKLASACLGIAGPIENPLSPKARVTITNLGWTISAAETCKFLNVKKTWLINDLEAIANGIDQLTAKDVKTLIRGKPKAKANRAVIAPGSGIGESVLYWDGKKHCAIATEGGHCSFSATGEEQIKLHKFLTQKFGHVSWERVISGPGLRNIYNFLGGTEKESADISESALEEEHPVAIKAIELFLDILANEAGNLALKCLSYGGVYIAGGVTPKISSLLDTARFQKAFTNKGRMAEVLDTIPVHLVVSETVGLFGAAQFALSR